MSTTPYNLDADQEYFEFVLKGHKYKFRYMTMEETQGMASIAGDKDASQQVLEYLYQFISSDEPDAPDFKEASKNFLTTQWNKFFEMLGTEFGIKELATLTKKDE